MAISASPWLSTAECATGRLLFQLPLPVLTHLANGDLESANSISEFKLTPYLISPECIGVWKRRLAQIKSDPVDAVWVTRLILDAETCVAVGRAGFHGQPDENGMVEIGYSVDPAERRKGHARAALRILLDAAKGDDRVKVVRATVRPDNIVSRALINQYEFKEVGEQWDEEDGLEIVLEISVDG